MLRLLLISTASAAVLQWAGSLSYPPYLANGPLNVTIDDSSNTGVFSWVYDVNGAGQKCAPDKETGLKWSVDGSGKVSAQGTGKDPSYYSFIGQMTGDKITGSIVQPNGQTVGTWSVQKDAPQVASDCGHEPPAWPLLWPVPTEYTNGTSDLGVVPSGNFFVGDPSLPEILTAAFVRYSDYTFPHIVAKPAAGHQQAPAGQVTKLTVTVASNDDSHPQLETDETYTLSIQASGVATLNAKTIYGAMHGLETFSQLVVFDFDTGAYLLPAAPWTIRDAPRFPHRGLMIDTARHFEPLSAIRGMIDSLPFAKLNVLHWHMSDSQSFPLQSTSSPDFWKGAYSDQERYTQADVASIVEYAHARGIRVMVEFDMPGHAASWCAGYPSICPSSTCTQPLNPSNPETFTRIENLLMEMTGGAASKPGQPSKGLFKDNFIHLGGDEVDTDCWTSTPAVNNWLQQQNLTADGAYAYFVKKAAGFAIAQGHRPVQWSEVFDHFHSSLPKETIVHIWKSVTNVTEVVADGYNVLINVGYDDLSWYLDNLNVQWSAVYQNEPCQGVPDNLCPLILGGHGEMWGETVDASDIGQTVWPRLGAIAERLWSPRATTDLKTALPRMEHFRCLLNRRGIAAAPVNNPNARSAPPGPGSCYLQR